MRALKILYVCHRFPYPPKRGGKIRPFNMIKHLSHAGHQVTVASVVRSEEEAHEGEGIRDYCANYLMGLVTAPAATMRMLAKLPQLVPSSMGYFYSPRLKHRIRQALRDTRFDFICVHCSSAAQYVEDVAHIPKMLDFGDMDSQKWLIYSRVRSFPLAWGYAVEGAKLQRTEAMLARKFDYCTCTTRAELETLDSYGTGARTGWFPNGVDAEFFCPGPEPYDPHTLCFVGRMDYYPNQQAMFEFCQHVLPRLRARRPALRLLIVGANPSRAVGRLGRLPGVTVTGSVPDVRPYVRQAALTVAPLTIARGTQNKILESLAMGTPVVASTLAAGGVDAVPGEHFLTASTPQDYIEAILELLDKPERRQQFARAGRERMLSHHNWASSMQKLDALIADCLSRWQETKRQYHGTNNSK